MKTKTDPRITEEMVEKVARAICVTNGEPPDYIGDYVRPEDLPCFVKAHAMPHWWSYQERARYVLECAFKGR